MSHDIRMIEYVEHRLKPGNIICLYEECSSSIGIRS